MIFQSTSHAMFENLAQIRHASRKSLNTGAQLAMMMSPLRCYVKLLLILSKRKDANMTYKIIRFYRELHKPSRVIKRGLTLEQARRGTKNIVKTLLHGKRVNGLMVLSRRENNMTRKEMYLLVTTEQLPHWRTKSRKRCLCSDLSPIVSRRLTLVSTFSVL